MTPVENRILTALVTNLSDAGFKPAAVWNGETYVVASHDEGPGLSEDDEADSDKPIKRPLKLTEILQVFDIYDMYAPTIHFTQKDSTLWSNRGVMVVEGNGPDFISDWHCPAEGVTVGDIVAFNAIVHSVASAASEGAFD